MSLMPDFERAVEVASAEAYFRHGNALARLNRFEAAIESYDRAIATNAGYIEAHMGRGYALRALKQYQAAIAGYDHVIAIRPDRTDAYISRGNALRALKRNAAAIADYDRAIALTPHNPEAYNNRGNALRDLGQLDAAIASYDTAIALKPHNPEAYNNRGNALRDLRRYVPAVTSYDTAIALKADYVDAYSNRGTTFADLKRFDEALASYDQAIALNPRYANAHNGRGNALADLKQYQHAIASYDRAIALSPHNAEAWYNRGNALRALKNYDAAIASYVEAMAIKPDYKGLRGMCLHTRMQICDWRDLETDTAELIARLELHEEASNPFIVLTASDSEALHRTAAEIWVQSQCPASRALPMIAKHDRGDRIRVGYVSADFHDHATSYLVAGMFEMHDRSRFEVTALSIGPICEDAMRKRLQTGCENFIDVRDKSDQDVALLARELEIDIAVDLKGFTQDNRAGIFALRAAPLQVSYLGYPGTMGAGYMDYLIADNTVVPHGSRCHFAEKIVYLPNSYQINDAARRVAAKVFTREELGLPPEGFVFCCFNNSYKITPITFAVWMRILHRVQGSVLWLLEDNPGAASNLRQEAARRDIDGERLIFAPRTAQPEHLARHGVADLFLDTLPYNAHTTASDALWAGVPVLTCAGNAFAGRVAASLLNAIRLPELITSSYEQYEQLAVELANNPQWLSEIRRNLAGNRSTAPLFNTRLHTSHLEAAYARIYERYQADLPITDIMVESS